MYVWVASNTFERMEIITDPAHAAGSLEIGQNLDTMPVLRLHLNTANTAMQQQMTCDKLNGWKVYASFVNEESDAEPIYIAGDVSMSDFFSVQGEGQSQPSVPANSCTAAEVTWDRLRVTAVGAAPSSGTACFKVKFVFAHKAYGFGRMSDIPLNSDKLTVTSSTNICLNEPSPLTASFVGSVSTTVAADTSFPSPFSFKIRFPNSSKNEYLRAGNLLLAVTPACHTIDGSDCASQLAAFNRSSFNQWALSQSIVSNNWCWYVYGSLVAGHCTPLQLETAYEGSFETFTVTFDELETIYGSNSILDLYDGAQLFSEGSKYKAASPVLTTATIKIAGTPTDVVMTVLPPDTVTVGEAFEVVCRVSMAGSPVARYVPNSSSNVSGFTLCPDVATVCAASRST